MLELNSCCIFLKHSLRGTSACFSLWSHDYCSKRLRSHVEGHVVCGSLAFYDSSFLIYFVLPTWNAQGGYQSIPSSLSFAAGDSAINCCVLSGQDRSFRLLLHTIVSHQFISASFLRMCTQVP